MPLVTKLSSTNPNVSSALSPWLSCRRFVGRVERTPCLLYQELVVFRLTPCIRWYSDDDKGTRLTNSSSMLYKPGTQSVLIGHAPLDGVILAIDLKAFGNGEFVRCVSSPMIYNFDEGARLNRNILVTVYHKILGFGAYVSSLLTFPHQIATRYPHFVK